MYNQYSYTAHVNASTYCHPTIYIWSQIDEYKFKISVALTRKLLSFEDQNCGSVYWEDIFKRFPDMKYWVPQRRQSLIVDFHDHPPSYRPTANGSSKRPGEREDYSAGLDMDDTSNRSTPRDADVAVSLKGYDSVSE